MIVLVAASVFAAIATGSAVYCVLVVIAARRYVRVRPQAARELPAISVLKPLAGLEEGLEGNLRSYFEQDYPAFEILFAVEDAGRTVCALVERLRAEYPQVPSRLVLTGEAPYPNPKTYKLDCLSRAASHDLFVMADSDVRVGADLLRTVAAEFADPAVGMATCPYRAVGGASLWSRLEAVMMNTEFLGGVLVARMLEGMRFALGPTIVARRSVIEAIGGFEGIRHYCAEDFVLGKFAAERGFGVILSSFVIEHRLATTTFRASVVQRMRWMRSTRRSRPAGYVGQVFTNPLPLVALMLLFQPWWALAAAVLAARAAAAWATAGLVLRDAWTLRHWWLILVQDVMSFGYWIAGFFGNTIWFRGEPFHLLRDGTYRPVGRATASRYQ